jgi:hypothetical protein
MIEAATAPKKPPQQPFDERAIESADIADLPPIVGELHRLAALALARLITQKHIAEKTEPEPALLDSATAAKLVSLPSAVALRRSKKFRPARRALGPRTLRWDRQVLLRAAGRAA